MRGVSAFIQTPTSQLYSSRQRILQYRINVNVPELRRTSSHNQLMMVSIKPGAAAFARLICPSLNLAPKALSTAPYHDALAFFNGITWTARLLSPSDVIPFITTSRSPASSQEDQFLGNTLATKSTIRHMLSFFEIEDASHVKDSERWIRTISTFVYLGDAVSGYPEVAHGGLLMSIADECMGMIAEVNVTLGKSGTAFESHCATGKLETNFLKPVPLNEVIKVTAEMEGMEGRKLRVRCSFAGEDGIVMVACSSTWITLKGKM